MIRPNLDKIKQWNRVPINELGHMLKEQGFQLNRAFSFEDHRVFVSQDGSVKIVLDRMDGKVFAGGNNKQPVHAFSVIPESGMPDGADKAYRV
jgi:hypothetical protein